MADNTALAKRMKENYEARSKQFLMRRCPTIIRLDGKAFHTYTKGLNKPFDEGLMEDMALTTAFLCENIQGVKCGYTQSDEISLLLVDYDKLETQAWFDYNVQKITSIASSLATAKFNQLRSMRKYKFSCAYMVNFTEENSKDFKDCRFCDIPLAFFDTRVFQISDKEEVVNYFLWRQRDAEKNSVAMLAQSLYSHKELHKKNGSDMQEMCFKKGYNWNDLSPQKKRGSFIIKQTYVNGEICKVYPDYIIGDTNDINKLEFYPKNCRGDIKKDTCRRYIPEWEEDSGYRDKFENVKIEKVRTKWEMVKETPFFGKERESILNFI